MFSRSAIAITAGGGIVTTAVGGIATIAGMGTDIGRTVTTVMRQGSILADLDLEATTAITGTMVITATTETNLGWRQLKICRHSRSPGSKKNADHGNNSNSVRKQCRLSGPERNRRIGAFRAVAHRGISPTRLRSLL